MNLKSIVKYNINSLKNSIITYYSIFIILCICSFLLSRVGNVTSSGLETSSLIFIFVVGLNSFKENFYFMKSNNVPRKAFLYGTALSMIIACLFMAIIDIVINRIYNIFIKSPTIYDMAYSNIGSTEWYNINWIQSNSIESLVNTFTLQFALLLASFSLGLLITIIYYKCNKLMKVVVSIVPVTIFIYLNVIASIYPNIGSKINKLIATIFGFNTQNSYAAVLTFIVLSVIFIGISRLLTRKAIIKQG